MDEKPLQPRRRHTLPRALRLRGKLTYNDIFDNGFRQTRGPIVALARRNELGHARLGLAVPGRVGIAAKRNRIKRLIRESFRLMQHDHARGYDLIILVRPHTPLPLAEYQRLLSGLVVKLMSMMFPVKRSEKKEPPSRDESPSS